MTSSVGNQWTVFSASTLKAEIRFDKNDDDEVAHEVDKLAAGDD